MGEKSDHNQNLHSSLSSLTRRQAIAGAAATVGMAASGIAAHNFLGHGSLGRGFPGYDPILEQEFQQPAFAIIPIVQFGKHVWKDPPKDITGYVDPRTYEISVGIEWIGTGQATQIRGSTVAPLELDEQKIEEFNIEKSPGCDAMVRPLSDDTGQLEVFAPSIERGQKIAAVAKYKMTLFRNCPGFDRDSFPAEQKVPRDFGKAWLGNSPGIETKSTAVKKVLREIVNDTEHPWDKAKLFHQWVWENIKGRVGDYTSVKSALKNRVGDCEERATVFIALCRAAGIPARMVWVPNHAWAEFCMIDADSKAHWLPSHTAAYPWFGWTGTHELVFQKGDRIHIPQTGKKVRLVKDWMSWRGSKPKFKFTASVKPVPKGDETDVPGGRIKLQNGEWGFMSKNPENKYMRE